MTPSEHDLAEIDLLITKPRNRKILYFVLGSVLQEMSENGDSHDKLISNELMKTFGQIDCRVIALNLWNEGSSWEDVYDTIRHTCLGFGKTRHEFPNFKALQTAVIRYAKEMQLPIRRGKGGRPTTK